MESESPEVRLDKFLWSVRLYKTRAEATTACRGGLVHIDGQTAKPSRLVKITDMIFARVGVMMRQIKVVELTDKRVGPKLVGDFIEDHTPAAEYLKLRNAREEPAIKRPKGSGRPTKKERRQWESISPKNAL